MRGNRACRGPREGHRRSRCGGWIQRTEEFHRARRRAHGVRPAVTRLRFKHQKADILRGVGLFVSPQGRSNMKTTGLAAGMAFALVGFVAGPTGCAEDAPFTVAEGNKVDKNTPQGWRPWLALACGRVPCARRERPGG